MSRLWVFIRRDWLIQSSYRTSFGMQLGQVVFTMASFFFIGKLVDPHQPSQLASYGGTYFPFVVLGLAGSRYLGTILSGFGGTLRDEQLQGTLEAMLTTPTPFPMIVLGGLAWDLCWTTVEVAAYLGIGAWLFGLDLGDMNVMATLTVLALSVVSLSSLGALAACGVLLFKEFDPVTWLMGGVMKLVGGVYFPVAVLPGWLQGVASWLPLTYALEGLRQAVLMGRSVGELQTVCWVLGGVAAVGWPLACLGLSWTLRRLKTTGALSFR